MRDVRTAPYTPMIGSAASTWHRHLWCPCDDGQHQAAPEPADDILDDLCRDEIRRERIPVPVRSRNRHECEAAQERDDAHAPPLADSDTDLGQHEGHWERREGVRAQLRKQHPRRQPPAFIRFVSAPDRGLTPSFADHGRSSPSAYSMSRVQLRTLGRGLRSSKLNPYLPKW